MTNESRLPNPSEMRQLVRRILKEYKSGRRKEDIAGGLASEGWDRSSIEHLINNIEETYVLSSPAGEKKRAERRGVLKFIAFALYAICLALFVWVPEATQDRTFFRVLAIAFGVAGLIVYYLSTSWHWRVKR